MPVDDMFSMLKISNFLQIKGLLRLMIKTLALQMQGKTVEEIRTTFNVEDPKWTEEELENLKNF